jgi:hypothetical protein
MPRKAKVEQVQSAPPIFVGDSVRYRDKRWYVDQQHMFRTRVLPHKQAFDAYTDWINNGVEKYTCYALGCVDDYFEERAFLAVCVLHQECQQRNKRVDKCPTCQGKMCFCERVVDCIKVRDLIMYERIRAYEDQVVSYSPETQRTMTADFWELIFQVERTLPRDQQSTTQQQLLYRAWARRRHGLFFLREIYNPSVLSNLRLATIEPKAETFQ